MNINLDDFDIPGEVSKNNKEEYESYIGFLKSISRFSESDLVSRGFVKSMDDKESLANLFQNRLIDENQLFRKRPDANETSGLIWQAKVASTAFKVNTEVSLPEYKGIDRSYLTYLARMSEDPNVITKLPEILSEKGIVLIYQLGLPAMKIDGSVFVNHVSVPVIGISFRYSRLDHFWFTLMHELSHLVLHFDRLDSPILDDLENESSQENAIEVQANRLAKQSLVGRFEWRSCKARYTKKEEDVVNFAKKMGVHPAIVAGILNREIGDYSKFRELVNNVNTREIVFKNE